MRLAPDFAMAGWYFKNRVLHDLALPHPEVLSPKEKRRLKHYYYGTTYLNSIFCTLLGYRRSRREKRLFSNLSALACFFDDLVDAFRQHDNSGIAWFNNPELFGQPADPRGLAQHFLNNVYRDLPGADLVEWLPWLLGLPTGAVIIFLNRFIPESPRFLAQAGLTEHLEALLAEIQTALYDRALRFREERTADVSNYEELKAQIEKGFARAYWAGTTEDEKRIQDEIRATIRCIPLDQPGSGGTCVYTGKPATQQVIFARAY